MKKYYCYGKKDFCNDNRRKNCSSCKHYDGNGGEHKEIRFNFFERFKYWLKNPHKKACRHCCLFCKFYDTCKDDNE